MNGYRYFILEAIRDHQLTVVAYHKSSKGWLLLGSDVVYRTEEIYKVHTVLGEIFLESAPLKKGVIPLG